MTGKLLSLRVLACVTARDVLDVECGEFVTSGRSRRRRTARGSGSLEGSAAQNHFVNKAVVRACGRQNALEETDAGKFKCRKGAFEIERETGLGRGAA